MESYLEETKEIKHFSLSDEVGFRKGGEGPPFSLVCYRTEAEGDVFRGLVVSFVRLKNHVLTIHYSMQDVIRSVTSLFRHLNPETHQLPLTRRQAVHLLRP